MTMSHEHRICLGALITMTGFFILMGVAGGGLSEWWAPIPGGALSTFGLIMLHSRR